MAFAVLIFSEGFGLDGLKIYQLLQALVGERLSVLAQNT
jgi:hypothetical protein